MKHVRAAAIRAMAKLPGAAQKVIPLLDQGTVREQQAAFEALAEIDGKDADDATSSWMDKLIAHQAKPEMELDILDTAAKRKDPAVARKVQQYEQTLSKTDPYGPLPRDVSRWRCGGGWDRSSGCGRMSPVSAATLLLGTGEDRWPRTRWRGERVRIASICWNRLSTRMPNRAGL